MEIKERVETWTLTPNGELIFGHTTFCIQEGDEHYAFNSSERGIDQDITNLPKERIPLEDLLPEMRPHFTKAPEGIPQSCYAKKPTLLSLHMDSDHNTLAEVILHEVEVCEILKNNPHPNIAQYLGCVVEDNKIHGLCMLYESVFAFNNFERKYRLVG